MHTILVVEDQPLIGRLLRVALEPLGDVHVTETAADALSVARATSRLDLLVTDIHMPGLTGFELAVQLERERPDLPVLFVSSECGPGFPAELSVPRDFLAKPFAIAELRERARRLLMISRRSPA